jgi:hypothetical protein
VLVAPKLDAQHDDDPRANGDEADGTDLGHHLSDEARGAEYEIVMTGSRAGGIDKGGQCLVCSARLATKRSFA